jgi:hypothetical protein
MALGPCFVCAREISTSAFKCPHCGTDEPQGTRCCICNKPSKKAEMVDVARDTTGSEDYEVSYRHYYFHKLCIEARDRRDGDCYECGSRIVRASNWSGRLDVQFGSCPKCGAPNPLKFEYLCHACGENGSTQLHGKQFLGNEYSPNSYHPICGAARNLKPIP